MLRSQREAAGMVVHFFHQRLGMRDQQRAIPSSLLRNCMKPAADLPSSVSPDPSLRTVCCLRCEQKLNRYQLMRTSLVLGSSGHAILSCPRFGHVEFVSDSSPLLQSLELVPVDTG